METNRRDNFISSVDWISITNDGCSLDELISMFVDTNIDFNKRYIFNNEYLVITNDSYREFFDFYETTLKNYCRFTRLDLKYDYLQEFKEMKEDFLKFWQYKSGIVDREGLNTIYFNSRNTDIFCRLYNKTLESSLSFPLSRLEYEIKGSVIRQFSYRYRFTGLDDALDYLFSLFCEFNYNKGIDSIIQNFNFKQPVPLNIIEHIEKKEKFRKFLTQYRYSILDYLKLLGDDNELFDLCRDMSDFDKIIS